MTNGVSHLLPYWVHECTFNQPQQFWVCRSEQNPHIKRRYVCSSMPNRLDGTEPVAFFFHDPSQAEALPVRVHDACFTSEVWAHKMWLPRTTWLCHGLHRQRRWCCHICSKKAWMVWPTKSPYIPSRGRLRYSGSQSRTPFSNDAREYGFAEFMLKDLNIQSITLMTNNPRKIDKLKEIDVNVAGRLAVHISPNPHSQGYLQAKQEKMGHMLKMKK